MAHNSQIDDLVAELVVAVTKAISKTKASHYKSLALRTLATSKVGRTNQFEVDSRLHGLEEKCRILNKDSLADAMHFRVEELWGTSNKWTPEYLDFLLQMSDRPVHSFNVDTLLMVKADSRPDPSIWSPVDTDDLSEDQDGIWKNIDFAADASDENETTTIAQLKHSERTPDSSILGSETDEGYFDNLIVHFADGKLREIQGAQFWRPGTHEKVDSAEQVLHTPHLIVTERQLIREIIHMLLGLRTSIYTLDGQQNTNVLKNLGMRHVPQESLIHILTEFGKLGDKLLVIRHWITMRKDVTVEQTFQAALASRLHNFDAFLSGIQAKILDTHTPVDPTLLGLYHDVCNASRYILQTYGILVDLQTASQGRLPFQILECLFESTCSNQSIGDTIGYEYLATLFFECFQTYLRSVRFWMETGEIGAHDRLMFIQRSMTDVSLSFRWQDQYRLLHDSAGSLHAPKFLHVAAQKIFVAGKSVDFLNCLGCTDQMIGTQSTIEPDIQPASLGDFSPFPELFDKALHTWITSKYCSSSAMLRNLLDSQCGLQRSLDALEFIFLFRNGALSYEVNSKIFERLDQGYRHWSDSFILTKSFQDAFSSVHCVDIDHIKVTSEAKHLSSDKNQLQRSMNALNILKVNYALSWPIANIINEESMRIYQRIFVLLTQLQRSKYLVQQVKFTQASLPVRRSAFDDEAALVYAVRLRLLWLTNTIMAYITGLLIPTATSSMRASVAQAEDFDAMIAAHSAYVRRLEDHCLLAGRHASIHKALISLLDLAILFSDAQAPFGRRGDPSSRKHDFLPNDSLSRRFRTSQREKAGLFPTDDEDNGQYIDDTIPLASSTSGFDKKRLQYVYGTFTKLHGFVTVAVQGLSKADGSPCWEVLAHDLAVELGKG